MEFLKANTRLNSSRHFSRKLRREGKIPGILYGKGMNNIMFEVGELELNKEVLWNGEYGKLNINLNGGDITTLIKEVQRDPATNQIIHIDLEKIQEDDLVEAEVPVVFSNENNIVKSGGIVQKEKDSVRIKCKASSLPKYLNASLTRGKIGTVIRVEDLEVSEEISFVDDIKAVLASISYVSIKDKDEGVE